MHHQGRRRLAVQATALVTATVLAGWPAARAAELQPPLAEYLVTSWSDRDGVPIGTVYAVAQDASGYLWLGTESGLVRFDGFRFIPATAVVKGALPPTGATAVGTTPRGSILVGFSGGEVVRIDSRAAQAERLRGQSLGRIDALVEDNGGTTWVVAQGRAYRHVDRQWEEVAVDSTRARIVNAYRGPSGRLYLTSGQGVYGETAARGVFEQLSMDFAYAASEGPHGDVWSTHPVYGIVHARGASNHQARLGNGYRMIHDRDGHLWVATIGKGLWRVRLTAAGSREIDVAPAPALPGDAAQALFEDRERNIWIGTPTGLHRLTRKPLTPVANAGPILAIEATDGDPGIWAGTLFDGLVRFSHAGGTWQRTIHSGPDVIVRSFHRDRAGTIWLGTAGGLARLERDHPALVARPPLSPNVLWLTSDYKGTLWLGDRRRLFTYRNGRLEQTTEPWAERPVELGASDRQGRLWFAFGDGSIGVLDTAGAFRQVPGLVSGPRRVHVMFQDSSGTVWVGASDGLFRFRDGQLREVQLSSEWPGNQVWAIVEDDQRFLWVNTDLGLLRIEPGELARASDASHRLRYQFFDGNDGLAGASVEYLRAVKGNDSTVWFARGGALTAIDPGGLQPTAAVPAAVQIESVATDRGALDIATKPTLSAGTRRLDVTFSVLHLSPTPRLRFRHRLEGFDRDWRDAGTRNTASYMNLPPGSYRLVVEAYSTQGTFGRAATWAFELPPALYETRAFRILALLAVSMIVVAAWWLRTRLVRRQFAAVLAERARVSREIHDTLLQGVLGISLHLDHLEHAPAMDETENRRRFGRLRLQLEAYIRDARQSILDLRSPVLEHRTFEEALNELAARLTADTGMHFSVKVRGKPRECPPRVENELLRIAHEAIVNAVRHSGGDSIQVELRFDDTAIVLRVADDGHGFDLERASSLEPARFGLLSMQERAKTFGGKLSIVTSIQRGTDVEAVFPMRAVV